ncbi:hypothetical protein JCM11251_003645 [Rhodosporidiobolus azoricus]
MAPPATPPKILVRAGPSLSHLEPVTVNSPSSSSGGGGGTSIKGPLFEGSVAVRLVHYPGPRGEKEPPEGCELEDEGETWSISFEGRFGGEGHGDEVGVDDIMFGNSWTKPIRDYLPYGTSAALRFVKYVDPSLSCDLYADEPWALSPLFATLQRVSVRSTPSSTPLPTFEPKKGSFPEDVSPLLPSGVSPPPDSAARRSYFTNSSNRASAKPLTRDLVVRGDFSHGFIDFSTLSLALPGGLKFSLASYWNGEPVAFVCRHKGDKDKVFFVVTFELVDEEGAREGAVGEGAKKKEAEEEEEKNDDVD